MGVREKERLTSTVYFCGIEQGKKLSAPPPGVIDRLCNDFDVVLIEADGSKRRAIKGWNDTEPVIHPRTTKTVGLISTRTLGKPVNEAWVHRPERFLNITTAKMNKPLRLTHIIRTGFFLRRVVPVLYSVLRRGANMKQSAPLIIVRGAGDLASGVLAAIHISDFRVLALETENPSAIRRTVAFSEAVRLGHCTIERIEARLIAKEQAAAILSANDSESGADADSKANPTSFIPIAVDPTGELIDILHPAAVIDAIIAKKNCGTRLDMAPLVIALGPGFTAGKDAHIVIETMRGHNLARLIYRGTALPNTGVPGLVGGESVLRVIHAPAAGTLRVIHDIGDSVTRGEVIARIIQADGSIIDVAASLNGIIRGMLPDGFVVRNGLKMADIDPRLTELNNCFTISDKARALGGAVLTALLSRGIVPSPSLH